MGMAAQAIEPSEYPTTTLGRLVWLDSIDFVAGARRVAPGPGHRAKHVASPLVVDSARRHLLMLPLPLVSADGSMSRDTSWRYDRIRAR